MNRRIQYLLTFMFCISLITAIGVRLALNHNMHQATATVIVENKPISVEDKPEPDLTGMDLEKAAAERNAQSEPPKQVSRGATSPEKELIGEFKLTFYTPSADETDNTPSITATGARVKPGVTVAVDPRYWKLGTEFYVEGYGYVVAEDTGSKIKGPNVMDICVETKDQALKNGIQFRKVWVLKT